MQKQYIYNHPSIPLQILSIGTATCRFKSILYQKEWIIVPIGTSIAIYDHLTLQKIRQFQSNQSTIYSLIQNQKYIYSVGHEGDICQLDADTLQVVKFINHRIGSQCRWTSQDGNYFLISAEHSTNKGIVQVLDSNSLDLIRAFDGQYFYGCVQNNLFYVLKSQRYGKLSKDEKAKLNYKDLKKYKNNKQFLFKLEIHDKELIKAIPFETDPGEIVIVAESPKYIAYFYYDRRVLVFDIIEQTYQVIKNEGNGVIQAACFQNDHELVYQHKPKTLTTLNLQTGETSQQEYKTGLNSIVQCIFKNDQVFLMASEENITLYRGQHMVHKAFGGLTKCGLDFYKEDQIVSGDFLGNLTINNLNTGEEVNQLFLGIPIRSIACKDTTIYIGTMDGSLFKSNGIDIEPFDQIEGAVTCIRVKEQDLLVSTTNGLVRVYRDEKALFTFLAHPPKQNSELFGSLDIHADIWTCIFNPIAELFATGSEDQTVKVFDYSQKQIVELTGHKLAVTCLDWKQSQNQLILYSCSDDRTIRLYDEKYTLLKVLNTFFINEWFTLTYMSTFEDKIAIGSQSGYFFLIEKDEFKVAQKIHMGGIEGLVMRKNVVVTCSSDDCLSVIKVE